MLLDFYTLETFFGAEAAAQKVEKLIDRYGVANVQQFIEQGLIEIKSLPAIDQSYSSHLCWLSDKGRLLAQKAL